jgi:hypothetical protein
MKLQRTEGITHVVEVLTSKDYAISGEITGLVHIEKTGNPFYCHVARMKVDGTIIL